MAREITTYPLYNFPGFLPTEFLREIAGGKVLDPFDERVEVELFKIFLRSNEEEFKKYNEELKAYPFTDLPDSFYKSADIYICKALDYFKENDVEKPATKLQEIMNEIGKKVTSPFTDTIKDRLNDTMAILNQFKAGDKKAEKELKERGFI
jgi:hypothetical protein